MAYATLVDENKAKSKYISINKTCCRTLSSDSVVISIVSKNATAGMTANRVNLKAKK